MKYLSNWFTPKMAKRVQATLKRGGYTTKRRGALLFSTGILDRVAVGSEEWTPCATEYREEGWPQYKV